MEYQDRRGGRGGRGGGRGDSGGRGRGSDRGRERSYSESSANSQRGEGERGGRGGGDRQFTRGGGGGGRGRPSGIIAPLPGQPPVHCDVVTNSFKASFSLPEKQPLFCYRVDFENPTITDDKLWKAKATYIFNSLIEQHKELQNSLYDASHTLYNIKDFGELSRYTVVLVKAENSNNKDNNSNRVEKEKKQDVVLKRTGQISNYSHQLDATKSQILELALRFNASKANEGKGKEILAKGKNIYDFSFQKDLKDSDLAVIPGFSHGFSLSDVGLMLTTDSVNQIIIRPNITLVEYLLLRLYAFNFGKFDLPELVTNKALGPVFKMLNRELKNKLFTISHLKIKGKRIYKLSTDTARSKKFEWTDPKTGKKRNISVEQYFNEIYGLGKKYIKRPDDPLVVVKRSNGREDYIPIELCVLAPGQMRGYLSSADRTQIIDVTRKDLAERFRLIEQYVKDKLSGANSSTPFKLQVDSTPIQVQGKILAPPELQYGNNIRVVPNDGAWRLEAPLLGPQQIELLFIYPDSFDMKSLGEFRDKLLNISGGQLKMKITTPKPIPYTDTKGNYSFMNNKIDVELFVSQIRDKLVTIPKEKRSNIFVLVVLTDKTAEKYNSLKSELDLKVEITSQFILRKNIEKGNASLLINVAAAINVKAWNSGSSDSRNTQVVGNLPLMDKPTGIVGIDVHHPPPGSTHPSEAALSGTLNKHATSYYSTFRSQKSRSESIPQIKDMFTEYLTESLKKLKIPFARLIVIRDGVADTQFTSVCKEEIDSIKDALKEHPAYKGKAVQLLYLVAQKRNLCRLGAKGKEGDIVTPLPGTVIDHTITSRMTTGAEADFYMIGHKAIQGSAKPLHYWVIKNEVDTSPQFLEQLQNFLFKLCHLHPGCTRSVSQPIPLYNAHKLAYRIGQVYRAAQDVKSDAESETGSDKSGSGKAEEIAPIQLPEFIKFTPFFL